MPMNAHNIRVDDELWERAGARAANEDTDRSTLIRQWLQDYVDGDMPHIPLTTAQREALELIMKGR
jgi:predicted transcriptional regulator